MNTDGYKISTHNRENGKRGGGLALVYKESLDVTLKSNDIKITFEYAVWQIKKANKITNILVVYHPPPSDRYQHTNTQFTDEFLELVSNLMSTYTNMIILGDFNLHVNDAQNEDAIQFLSAMDALGFEQRVNFCTHKDGNTLDLVFTSYLHRMELKDICSGQFLSDHCTILLNLSAVTEKWQMERVTYRNFKKVDIDKFYQDAEIDKLLQESSEYETNNINFDDFLSKCNTKFKEAMDKNAPEKTKRRQVRINRNWYNEELHSQKQTVRHREKIWRKYHQDHQWTAYKKARNKYRLMLRSTRESCLHTEILKNKGNAKALYNIISNLSGNRVENPLPPSNDNSKLAQTFSNFFMEKITKIRNELEKHPQYNPPT